MDKPAGNYVKRCLENTGMIPLHLIGVQSGAYPGEDDIVRYENKCN
ncbi:hypothetical protein TPL01_11440 [Sulfuriferula plumbiphila]|uniref:Mannose-6-phosphate isomerase type II C-terminal domain-containing protein n=1 Tax=Sulfuriferula plumbiphila TaxID=171865 RepID=A0A512L697_9PROT|nr:hypothetical protein SFPGR_10270 [Sulfuriferula plumbiphila]GEP30006.1 hypothetical protein TPL01_11440 [Sulfuriferula plumbiphila]